jgi:hypothetical protein
MQFTVVGSGVLGQIYGVRLAAAGEQISFVVRPERAGESAPFVLEQVNGPHRRDVVERPERVTQIPRGSAAVFVAVRFDQLAAGSPLVGVLREAPTVPLIVLTPMLPRQRALVEQAIGRRVVPAMPGAVGYLDDRSVVRYWLTSIAPTLVDGDPRSKDGPALDEILHRLGKAGLPAHRERDVGALNAATTTAFFPLIAGIDAGGGVDRLLGDKELFATVIDAAHESAVLGQKLGKVASWAHLLTRFVGPYTLKPAVALARTLAPEALRFAESHFGPKLHAQHVAMGDAILEIARELGQEVPALARLMDVLRARVA